MIESLRTLVAQEKNYIELLGNPNLIDEDDRKRITENLELVQNEIIRIKGIFKLPSHDYGSRSTFDLSELDNIHQQLCNYDELLRNETITTNERYLYNKEMCILSSQRNKIICNSIIQRVEDIGKVEYTDSIHPTISTSSKMPNKISPEIVMNVIHTPGSYCELPGRSYTHFFYIYHSSRDELLILWSRGSSHEKVGWYRVSEKVIYDMTHIHSYSN